MSTSQDVVDSNLQFRIASIRTARYTFSDLESNTEAVGDYGFRAQATMTVDPKEERIEVRTRIKATWEDSSEDDPFLELETETVYDVLGLTSLPHDDGEVQIPSDFLVTLLSIAISTTRGILLEKTADTGVGRMILPPIDPEELLGGQAAES